MDPELAAMLREMYGSPGGLSLQPGTNGAPAAPGTLQLQPGGGGPSAFGYNPSAANPMLRGSAPSMAAPGAPTPRPGPMPTPAAKAAPGVDPAVLQAGLTQSQAQPLPVSPGTRMAGTKPGSLADQFMMLQGGGWPGY